MFVSGWVTVLSKHKSLQTRNGNSAVHLDRFFWTHFGWQSAQGTGVPITSLSENISFFSILTRLTNKGYALRGKFSYSISEMIITQ